MWDHKNDSFNHLDSVRKNTSLLNFHFYKIHSKHLVSLKKNYYWSEGLDHKMWYKMHFVMILEIALILKPSAECQKAQKIVFLKLMPHFCIVGVKTKLLLGYWLWKDDLLIPIPFLLDNALRVFCNCCLTVSMFSNVLSVLAPPDLSLFQLRLFSKRKCLLTVFKIVTVWAFLNLT